MDYDYHQCSLHRCCHNWQAGNWPSVRHTAALRIRWLHNLSIGLVIISNPISLKIQCGELPVIYSYIICRMSLRLRGKIYGREITMMYFCRVVVGLRGPNFLFENTQGTVTFGHLLFALSIFPAACAGQYPHIQHREGS